MLVYRQLRFSLKMAFYPKHVAYILIVTRVDVINATLITVKDGITTLLNIHEYYSPQNISTIKHLFMKIA